MHAYLFVGNDTQTRTESIEKRADTLGISRFDRVTVDTQTASIGIGDVRKFIHDLSLAPQENESVGGIIPEADLLTIEAQQALLKTLEEPPPHAYLFLGASHTGALLPTIVSRCLVITVPAIPVAYPTDLSHVTSLSPGNVITYLARMGKTKEDYVGVFDALLFHLRNTKETERFHRLLTARQYLSNNVHPLILLEHILLDKGTSVGYNDS